MSATGVLEQLSYADRLTSIRARKQLETIEKQRVRGTSMTTASFSHPLRCGRKSRA